MKPHSSSTTILIAVLCCTIGLVTPASAQADGGGTVSCGQFTADQRFGETDFEFYHDNLNQCAALTTPGLTLVDVQGVAIGPDGNHGVTYTEVCQCTQKR